MRKRILIPNGNKFSWKVLQRQAIYEITPSAKSYKFSIPQRKLFWLKATHIKPRLKCLLLNFHGSLWNIQRKYSLEGDYQFALNMQKICVILEKSVQKSLLKNLENYSKCKIFARFSAIPIPNSRHIHLFSTSLNWMEFWWFFFQNFWSMKKMGKFWLARLALLSRHALVFVRSQSFFKKMHSRFFSIMKCYLVKMAKKYTIYYISKPIKSWWFQLRGSWHIQFVTVSYSVSS